MKKLKPAYLLNLVAALAVMIAMPSCSDDTDLPAASADGDTVITLHVPNPSAAESSRSRAAGDDPAPSYDITTAEGAIKSLWLLAYDTKGSNHVVKQLQSGGEVSSDYTDYSIQFTPGSYRFYVVANLDSYIDKSVSAATAEDELKAMILRFSPEKLPNLADGLPMACLPDEIDEADADGIVTIAPGEKKQVLADMRFLCAKVRYTILFNNDKDGFSYDTFGEHSISFTGASATGVIASTTLLRAESSPVEGSFALNKVPLESVDYVDKDNTGAWRGTVYLPENLSTEKKSLTTLLLNATLDGSDAALRYTITLPSPEKVTSAEKPGSLQRGHFYDLTGRVTSLGDRLDLTAEVKDWTLLQLVYDIHGPYFLHVEKTKVEVQSGVETLIKYDTDAGELQFESEKLDGKDLFVFSTVTDEDGEKYISVNVNPEIPASNREVERHYFYIKAANLRKRIEVDASLNPFLNVTPTEIEINVREYISSGEYSAEIPISFTTNLDNVEISGFGAWDSSIALDGEMTTTEKTGTNNLLLSGMNGGDFWKSEHTLTLTYTATTGGINREETVTITVKPNVLNYLIHFRAPTDWTHPHIYVYQCLQLPANRNDSYKSKTVGYWDNSDVFAALEYSFTGKIAFKGWNDSNNDPNAAGTTENNKGFFMFNDHSSWNPNSTNFTTHYYNNYDFCESHRDSVSNKSVGEGLTECNACKNNPNKTWPGILMHNDGNGWWTFELSGVATPGKALIMFSNGHPGDNKKRYPELIDDVSQPGIPLFDYPSHEGWLDYANGAKQFTSTKPKEKERFKLQWAKTNDLWKIYISDADTGLPYLGMSADGVSYSYVDNNVFEYSFYFEKGHTDFQNLNIVLINGNNTSIKTKPIKISLSDFNSSDPRFYRIPDNKLVDLDNSSSGDTEKIIYRIYWYKDSNTDPTYRDAIHYNIDGKDGYKQATKSEMYDGYERFYYDVEITKGQSLSARAYNWISSGNYHPSSLTQITNSSDAKEESGKPYNYSFKLY